MDRETKFEKTYIEKMLMDNFLKLMPSFYEMQSSFLSGIYKRYGDLEGGHIVIFFARDLHLEILRKREKDLITILMQDLLILLENLKKGKDIIHGGAICFKQEKEILVGGLIIFVFLNY